MPEPTIAESIHELCMRASGLAFSWLVLIRRFVNEQSQTERRTILDTIQSKLRDESHALERAEGIVPKLARGALPYHREWIRDSLSMLEMARAELFPTLQGDWFVQHPTLLNPEIAKLKDRERDLVAEFDAFVDPDSAAGSGEGAAPGAGGGAPTSEPDPIAPTLPAESTDKPADGAPREAGPKAPTPPAVRGAGEKEGTRTDRKPDLPKVDFDGLIVTWQGNKLALNPKSQFALAAKAITDEGQIVTFLALMKLLAPDDYTSQLGRLDEAPVALRTAFTRINSAFASAGCPWRIHAVRGEGYRLTLPSFL